MSDNGKIPGPKNLEQWFKVLPGLLDKAKQGKIISGIQFGAPTPPPPLSEPQAKSDLKICLIDGKYFGGLFVVPANSVDALNRAEPGICPSCEKQLESGHTAFISPDGRSLMAKPNAGVRQDMRGKVVRLTNEQMNELWKRVNK